MNGLVLIDTSAWICFFARKEFADIKRSVSFLLDENMAAMAGPILVELLQGARSEEERNIIKTVAGGIHWF